MTRIEEIDVTIRPDSSVDIKVRGVAGPSCLELTKKLERYLGARVTSREHTDDIDAKVEVKSAAETTTRG